MKVMMRLAYDGSRFQGFQIQNSGVPTVANRLQEIFHSLGIREKFNASGRTDSGVHATDQVIDIRLPGYWKDLQQLQKSLNKKALPDIYIKKIEKVPEHFHARYSAKRRRYRYLVSTQTPSVFKAYYRLYTDPFDIGRVAAAVRLFEGRHDFVHFKKSGSDTTNFVRTIYRARFYQYGENGVFLFEADGFLRSQIRMMVDFLLKIGNGRLSSEALLRQLAAKEVISTDLCPPNGLYLSRIFY